MILDTLEFGLIIGYLIGGLSYLLMGKFMMQESDKRFEKMLKNVKNYLDNNKNIKDEEGFFEDG